MNKTLPFERTKSKEIKAKILEAHFTSAAAF